MSLLPHFSWFAFFFGSFCVFNAAYSHLRPMTWPLSLLIWRIQVGPECILSAINHSAHSHSHTVLLPNYKYNLVMLWFRKMRRDCGLGLKRYFDKLGRKLHYISMTSLQDVVSRLIAPRGPPSFVSFPPFCCSDQTLLHPISCSPSACLKDLTPLYSLSVLQ